MNCCRVSGSASLKKRSELPNGARNSAAAMTESALGLAVGMAGVTSLAVVGIAADLVMFGSHLTFTVLMAVDAGKIQVIGVQVTIATGEARMFSRIDGEFVVEYRLVPGSVESKMTVLAKSGITGLLVVRGGCIFVILLMAAKAIMGQVVASGMALDASQVLVGTLQRPKRIMIERRVVPGLGGSSVAGNTIGGITGQQVVWVLGSVVFL